MTQSNRQLLFVGAIVVAVILALIGVFYLTGHVVTSAKHFKHALLFWVLAVACLVFANFNRPGVAAR